MELTLKLTGQQIARDVEQIARKQRLGKPCLIAGDESAKLDRHNVTLFFVVFALFMLLGLIATVIVVLGKVLAATEIFAILTIPLPFMLVGAILGGTLAYANWSSALLYLCEHGLIRYYNTRKPAEFIRWDQVDAVWFTQDQRHRYTYTMRRADGTAFMLTTDNPRCSPSLANYEMLVGISNREITRRCLPLACKKYQYSGVVRFGKLSIDQHGLMYDEQLYTWSRIIVVKLVRDQIYVKYQRAEHERLVPAFFTCPVALVPNYCVLLALINTVQLMQTVA